jgi:hypothetical protein
MELWVENPKEFPTPAPLQAMKLVNRFSRVAGYRIKV